MMKSRNITITFCLLSVSVFIINFGFGCREVRSAQVELRPYNEREIMTIGKAIVEYYNSHRQKTSFFYGDICIQREYSSRGTEHDNAFRIESIEDGTVYEISLSDINSYEVKFPKPDPDAVDCTVDDEASLSIWPIMTVILRDDDNVLKGRFIERNAISISTDDGIKNIIHPCVAPSNSVMLHGFDRSEIGDKEREYFRNYLYELILEETTIIKSCILQWSPKFPEAFEKYKSWEKKPE
ncbi:MAG: hypothetical protein GY855_00755 [candidate division Zixibacteria bacterium]|nr:hypothetical protein [candidate division Zixibacteria bacterium]